MGLQPLLMLGGTSGGVAAGRLAAADPTLRILILEAGPTTEDDMRHVQPALYITHLRRNSDTVRVHRSRPSVALRGRSLVVPSGQCVGGGSSINCMTNAYLLLPQLTIIMPV
jgi:alcohol oxidase